MDSLLGYTLYHAVRALDPQPYISSMLTSIFLLFLWITCTKTIKFVGHFHRYPADLKFLPVLLGGVEVVRALCGMMRRAATMARPTQLPMISKLQQDALD
ncbi:MAG: hypothetical protein Q9221_009140 [Calogaya cf. arnoldii]